MATSTLTASTETITHNMTAYELALAPIISDEATSLFVLSALYGEEVETIFEDYQGKAITRTGAIASQFKLNTWEIAAKRAMYKDFFLKLGCIREELDSTTTLRGMLLTKYKSHTVTWGMSPSGVVAILLNSSPDFNTLLSLLLGINLPPGFSLGALDAMI
jgi:hypothetical protein